VRSSLADDVFRSFYSPRSERLYGEDGFSISVPCCFVGIFISHSLWETVFLLLKLALGLKVSTSFSTAAGCSRPSDFLETHSPVPLFNVFRTCLGLRLYLFFNPRTALSSRLQLLSHDEADLHTVRIPPDRPPPPDPSSLTIPPLSRQVSKFSSRFAWVFDNRHFPAVLMPASGCGILTVPLFPSFASLTQNSEISQHFADRQTPYDFPSLFRSIFPPRFPADMCHRNQFLRVKLTPPPRPFLCPLLSYSPRRIEEAFVYSAAPGILIQVLSL